MLAVPTVRLKYVVQNMLILAGMKRTRVEENGPRVQYTRSGEPAAFTRLELLVVLATLFVLVVVSVGRLGRAGVGGQAMLCLENHRAMSEAWTRYANDNAGQLVNNLTIAGIQATVNAKTYKTWANNILDWTKSSMNTNLSLVAASQLSPYLSGNVNVFKCPADSYLSAMQKQAGWTSRVRSYSMNAFMGLSELTGDTAVNSGANAFFPAWRQFLQLASIPDPGATFVFLDEHPDSINDGYFLNDPLNPSQWGDLPGSQHDGASGVGFADGHSELHVWTSPKTKVPVRFYYSPGVNDPAGRMDYQWLAARSTVDLKRLAVTRATNQLQVSWAPFPTNYVLQRSSSLDPDAWTNVVQPSVKVPGQRSTTFDFQGDQGFFRLRRP